MKRRIVWCLVLLTLASAWIFAGGGGEKPAPAADAPRQANLRFAWWGNDDRHTRTIKAIELYESLNPGIKIEPEPRGQADRDKIAAQLAGGNIADVSQLNSPWMLDFTSGVDFFVDLGAKSSILNTADFDQTFIKENCYYNGRLLALPLGLNYMAGYIDKHLADKFKIPTDLNSTTWTWEDFREIGKTVHAQDPNYYFMMIDQHDLLEMVVRPYLAQRTGKQLVNKENFTLNITRADLVNCFTFVASLYTQGVIVPAQEAFVFSHSQWTSPKWVNREALYMINWTSMSNAILGEFKPPHVPIIMPIPIAKDAKNTGIPIQPQSLIAVSNTSKSIDEGVRFISWFLNDLDAGRILGTTRSAPPSSKVQDMLVNEGIINQNLKDAIQWTTAHQGMTPDIYSTNAQVIQILTDAVEKVAYDASNVNAAADQAMKLMEDVLKGMKP
jgi:oligogalacturonide transport system substrate-binding protein